MRSSRNVLAFGTTKNFVFSIDYISIDSANNRKLITISRADLLIVHYGELHMIDSNIFIGKISDIVDYMYRDAKL